MAETLDALGVAQCGIYGLHTGALISLEFARRHAARVSVLVLDGLPLYTEVEREDLLERYSIPFEPRIDGSHLVSLWASYRDRFLFSPWYRHERSARRDLKMPDERELHEGVMDILRAGSGYGVGCAAAFQYRGKPALAELTVPTTILTHHSDVLEEQASRLPALPARVAIRHLTEGREPSAETIASLLAQHVTGGAVPEAKPAAAVAGRIWHDYANTRYGQIFVRRAGTERRTPLVLLHASPGSGRLLTGLIGHLSTDRPVLALDTLGNGDSDKPPWETAEIADYAPAVAEATDKLGAETFDLYGSHTGALIALETALLVPNRVRRLVLDGVPLFGPEESAELLARYTPPLQPRHDGTHLLFAWNFLRDQTLFWPWYNHSKAGIRWSDPLDANRLHIWLVEFLKSGHTYPIAYQAAFRYPTSVRLPMLAKRTLMVARKTDMLHSSTLAAAALAPDATAQTLPEDEESAARAITAFLDEPEYVSAGHSTLPENSKGMDKQSPGEVESRGREV